VAHALQPYQGFTIPVFGDISVLENVVSSIGRLGLTPEIVNHREFAKKALLSEKPDLVVCEEDFAASLWGNLVELLRAAPNTQFVFVTANPSLSSCVDAMSYGAQAYLSIPVDETELASVLQRSLKRDRLPLANSRSLVPAKNFVYSGVIGPSYAMQEVMAKLGRVSGTDLEVLILGENGTGKELAARAVHDNSKRAKGPFIEVHAATLSPSLVEAELFGYSKHSHSKAESDRIGLVEAANGGSLFLDEVGDIPSSIQVKLLRVLETKSFSRIGETRTRSSDFRLIAATNRDLEAMVKRGEFREDLYYRIKGFIIQLPSLRERKEDIPELVKHFVDGWNKRNPELKVISVPDETLDNFKAKHWGGNIRELKRTVETNAILSHDGVLHTGDQPLTLPLNNKFDGINELLEQGNDFDDFKEMILRRALERHGGNRQKASEELNIPQRTFYRNLKWLKDREEKRRQKPHESGDSDAVTAV
jgi:DNA-binding NtrC family response regulator